MSYQLPAINTPVVLAGNYTAPSLTLPVVLGGVVVIEGEMAASAVATPAAGFTGSGQVPQFGVLAASAVATPAAGFTGTGGVFLAVQGALIAPALAVPATLTGHGEHDANLPDPYGPTCGVRLHHGLPVGERIGLAQQHGTPSSRHAAVPQQHATPAGAGVRIPQRFGERRQSSAGVTHAHGEPLHVQRDVRQAQMIGSARRLRLAEPHGLTLSHGARVRHADCLHLARHIDSRDQQALLTALTTPVRQRHGWRVEAVLEIRWQQAEWPRPGRWWPFYEPPPLSDDIVLCQRLYAPRPIRCPVVLAWTPWPQPYCPGFTSNVIPVRRVYTVRNTFSLIRVVDSVEIPVRTFSATLSADAWVWSWSADVPGAALPLCAAAPGAAAIEVTATLNGLPLRLVIETLKRSRAFGSNTLTVQGRGRAAVLGEPYSPIITRMNDEERSARQLLDTALTVNGVSIGWEVDWWVEDWLVPPAAWSYTGTYIGAAQRIAEAAGGYVQAHDTAQTLHVKPWYPSPPWQWAMETPDLVLPDAVCVTEGIDWTDKPAYNAVWVVGGAQGRRDKIKRTGTAGTTHAPTIVDDLATATAMTRQRGIKALADTGRRADISLSLPILAEIGVLKPGAFIEYVENNVHRKGLIRSTQIHYQFPTARQTVSLETHESV